MKREQLPSTQKLSIVFSIMRLFVCVCVPLFVSLRAFVSFRLMLMGDGEAAWAVAKFASDMTMPERTYAPLPTQKALAWSYERSDTVLSAHMAHPTSTNSQPHGRLF